MADLTSFGSYPSKLRRVAVTNGADGTPQADQAGRVLTAGQQASLASSSAGLPSGDVKRGGSTSTIPYRLH
ncbi:MAG: hypothetical protein WKG07_10030 [Hymenobacter sp.]